MTQVKSNQNVTLTNLERKENSFRVELQAVVVKPNSSSSALSLMNEGDSRFDANSKRYAWMKVTPKAMAKYFGIAEERINALQVGEKIELNIEAPEIAGVPMNIEINENFEPESEYEVLNWKKAAKQVKITDNVLKSSKMKKSSAIYDARDAQGYFSSEGKLIFSHARVIVGVPNHKFIDEYQLITEEEAIRTMAKGVTLAPPSEVAEAVKSETEI